MSNAVKYFESVRNEKTDYFRLDKDTIMLTANGRQHLYPAYRYTLKEAWKDMYREIRYWKEPRPF